MSDTQSNLDAIRTELGNLLYTITHDPRYTVGTVLPVAKAIGAVEMYLRFAESCYKIEIESARNSEGCSK